MSEHQIRLRGGWECRAIGAPESAAQRLSLPTRWPGDCPRRLCLVRRFGRPPSAAQGQSLSLKLDQVPGIHCLLLNGQPLAHSSPGRSSYEIPLDHVFARNVLVLDIETPLRVHDPASLAPEWGFVALLIRPIDSDAASPSPIG
jgi:hypothetical protein